MFKTDAIGKTCLISGRLNCLLSGEGMGLGFWRRVRSTVQLCVRLPHTDSFVTLYRLRRLAGLRFIGTSGAARFAKPRSFPVSTHAILFNIKSNTVLASVPTLLYRTCGHYRIRFNSRVWTWSKVTLVLFLLCKQPCIRNFWGSKENRFVEKWG